jgi:hypothetical protein
MGGRGLCSRAEQSLKSGNAGAKRAAESPVHYLCDHPERFARLFFAFLQITLIAQFGVG